MNELKPCPFCGGKATIRHESSFDVYYIHCDTCNSETGNTGLYLEKGKAIEAWNTRAEPIVRCRDCVWYEAKEYRRYCDRTGSFQIEPGGFCKWGEEKLDET